MTESERLQLLKDKEAELAIAYEAKAAAYAKSSVANAAYDAADAAYNKAIAHSEPSAIIDATQAALIAAKAKAADAIFAAMDAERDVTCAKAAFLTASKAAKTETHS